MISFDAQFAFNPHDAVEARAEYEELIDELKHIIESRLDDGLAIEEYLVEFDNLVDGYVNLYDDAPYCVIMHEERIQDWRREANKETPVVPTSTMSLETYAAIVAHTAMFDQHDVSHLAGLETEASQLSDSEYNRFCNRVNDSNLKDTVPRKKP